jgi:glutathione peroxidase-family protein
MLRTLIMSLMALMLMIGSGEARTRPQSLETEGVLSYTMKDIDGNDVAWNFTKYLVNREGRVVGKFGSKIKPMSEELVSAVEKALQ